MKFHVFCTFDQYFGWREIKISCDQAALEKRWDDYLTMYDEVLYCGEFPLSWAFAKTERQ